MLDKEKVSDIAKEINNNIAIISEAIAENEDLVKNIGGIYERYGDILTPLVRNLVGLTIEMRKEAFQEFKKLGLSHDQAIKLACGR